MMRKGEDEIIRNRREQVEMAIQREEEAIRKRKERDEI
jgi:hypothetical protein